MTANPLPPVTGMGMHTATGANSAPNAMRMKPVDPVKLLRQHTLLLVATFIIAVGGSIGLFFVLDRYAPKYESRAQFVVQGGSNTWDAKNDMTDVGNLQSINAAMQNQILLMQSEKVLNGVLSRSATQQLDWAKKYRQPDGTFDYVTARRDFLDQLSVAPKRGSTTIEVSFTDHRQSEVQKLLTQHVDVYRQEINHLRQSSTADIRRTFTAILGDADQALKNHEARLNSFIQQHDIRSLQGGLRDEVVIEYTNLANEMSTMQLQLEGARSSYDSQLQKLQTNDLTPTPEEMAVIEQDPAVRTRDEKLRNLRETLGVLSDRVGAGHARVREMRTMMLETERERNSEVQRLLRERRLVQLDMARQAVESLESRIQSQVPKLEELGQRMTDMAIRIQQFEQLKSQQAIAEENRKRAEELLEEVRVREKRPDLENVQLRSHATEPSKVFPRPAIVIAGGTFFIMGLVIGGLFLREILDQRVKSPTDVKLLSNVDLLGVLPDVNEDAHSRSDAPAMIVSEDPAGLMAESFRQVRTSLLARMDRRGYKTLMVTGAKPECGSSTVISNLAASLAFNGRRVLVLDANFRRPSQHIHFNIRASAPGLVEVLSGDASIDDAIVTHQKQNIDVLIAGQSSHGHPELLEAPAFRSLLSNLESRYDLVLIDTPPALLASDSSLLAKHVDAVLLVVRAMRDQRGMVERMIRRLDGHRADVLGVVLNGVQSSAGGYFRKNYKEFYGYTGDATHTGNGKANGKVNGKHNIQPAPRPVAEIHHDRLHDDLDDTAQALSEINLDHESDKD